jgi:FtsP/CotA-like multicopper oxidase with cupredoxin domain
MLSASLATLNDATPLMAGSVRQTEKVDMKKAHRKILDNSTYSHGLSDRRPRLFRRVRALHRRLRKHFMGVIFAVGVVGIIVHGFSLVGAPAAVAELDNPPFANPPQIRSRPGEKRLRAIMEMINGEFCVSGLPNDQYRQFRGRDAAQPPRDPGASVGPGPTLRARLGDQVQIAFLNKVNRDDFPFTFVTAKDVPQVGEEGCDKVSKRDPLTKLFPYPLKDTYPNCFHGSNTANIHFHGTHTTPDGLGDNVLVQVLNDPSQPDWSAIFNQMYDSRRIPQKWIQLPAAFRRAQRNQIRKHDADARAEAIKNNETIPAPLLTKNAQLIAAGLWPEYFIGAFPNFFDIPDYDKATGVFNSGGNGYGAGQSPGTHWYHAHKHGSTSLHIRNGLAGTLIIESSHEGGYDHFIRKFYGWGDTYDDNEEKIFVVQQYDPTQNLERKQPNRGRGSTQNLVNGQLKPTITMRPGEVQLWRFVNATEGNLAGVIDGALFQTPGFTFKQTAKDGVQFSPDNYKNQPFLNAAAPNGMVPNGLTLAAGNRADLLVQAPATASENPIPFQSGGATLFYVKVQGDPVSLPNGAFPPTWAEMPKFLLDLPKPAPSDSPNPDSPVKFQWEKDRPGPGLNKDKLPPHFMINGRQFNETGPHVDQCMPQDGLQDWVLENYTTGVAHPFHIHINPFQVIRIETPDEPEKQPYAPENNFVWQDVIAIPAAHITDDGTVIPGRVIIRQRYPDFTGTFVLHCHILAHEDRGMMQLVRIVPRAQYRSGCQAHIPEHH